ncbi:MAG: LptF/LptG family permease, partial [Planctomycetota bacterium]
PMTTLDRYVLGSFFKNYAISLFVLTGLYIVLDMVFQFDEFAVDDDSSEGVLGAGEVIWAIASFYFFKAFLFFTQLAAVIPVVAAAFTLMRMSRFNEMTAVLAAGVPLLRVAAPIALSAVVMTFVVLVNHELVIPKMIPQLLKEHDQAVRETSKAIRIEALRIGEPEDSPRAGGSTLVYAGLFDPGTRETTATMRELTVLRRGADARPAEMITADLARWDPVAAHWQLDNGQRRTDIDPNDASPTQSATTPTTPVSNLDLAIDPKAIELLQSKDYIELLPLTTIAQLLDRPQQVKPAALLRVKHFRLSAVVANVVLVLLAIPCVLTREPGQLRRSAFQCLALTGACMGTFFLCQILATNPPQDPTWAARWPAIMAWTPVLIFAPVAVALLDRVKT